MAVSSNDFLVVAKELLTQPSPSEICVRSVINRAYYAVYHQGLDLVSVFGLSPERTNVGDHAKLVSCLQAGSKRLKVVANRIDSMRKVRAIADYNLATQLATTDAVKHLLSCEQIIQEMQKMCESHADSA